ncbi:MAG: diguanylate cyclase [Arenicellales bacterium]
MKNSIQDLQAMSAGEFIAYGDLNCPFCFALHERLLAWNLLDRIEWRLIVHAPELSSSTFSMEDQSLLANEVFSIHHRAPDVPVNLPQTRPGSEMATQFMHVLDGLPIEQQVLVRVALYRALWVEGENIADAEALQAVIDRAGLSDIRKSLESENGENPPGKRGNDENANSTLPVWQFWQTLGPRGEKFDEWQKEWETSEELNRRIPIIKHRSNDSLLLGLPTEEGLYHFLSGSRSFFVSDDVCVFQPRPIVLVFGSIENLWPLIKIIRNSCEVLHVSDSAQCHKLLTENESVDFLLIEHELVSESDFTLLSGIAVAKGVTRIVASRKGSDEAEMRALQSGAAEYLPLDRSVGVLTARFDKLVTDRRKSISMEHHAKLDGLTQIANRREFQIRSEQEWRQLVEKKDGTCALLLIDIDFFKAYNDTYGHLAGDACLKRVASILRSNAKGYEDFVARYGGEEFVLLLPDLSLEEAQAQGERLREAIESEGLEHAGAPDGSTQVTVSIGVASVVANEKSTPGDLVRVADACLYRAKAAGRNCVAC